MRRVGRRKSKRGREKEREKIMHDEEEEEREKESKCDVNNRGHRKDGASRSSYERYKANEE